MLRIPLVDVKQGAAADWRMYCDTPEEQLLANLYGDNRAEMEVALVGIEDGELVFRIWAVEKPALRLVKEVVRASAALSATPRPAQFGS